MKSNTFQEIGVAAILIILLVIILNPFHMWMPDMMHIVVFAALLVAFGVFASFILREKVEDERDSVHRGLAGRSAFLFGSAMLLIGILQQGLHGSVDPWLIATLVSMVVVKIITRMYSDRNY